MKNKFELSKNLALLTIILLIFSLLQLGIYYSFFHIDITKFIETSEIILIFSNELFWLILPFLAVLVFFWLPDILKPIKFTTWRNLFIYLHFTSFKERLLVHVKGFDFYMWSAALITVAMGNFLLPIKQFPKAIVLQLVCYVIVLTAQFFLNEIFIWLRKTRKVQFKMYISIYKFRLMLVFLLMAIISTTIRLGNSISLNRAKRVAFQYSKQNVQTTNTIFYIGKTREYIFLYDKERDLSKVYEMKNISNLSYTRLDTTIYIEPQGFFKD